MVIQKIKDSLYLRICLSFAAAFILMLSAGCSAQPDALESQSSTSSTSSSSSSSDSELLESTTSTSSVSSREHSTDNELSSSNSNDNDVNPESDRSEMSYMDYVIAYRDEIIDGAIDVEYEHFVAHPTGLKDGYVKFSGEIMQVFEDQAYGYDFYAVLMNITFVPGTYSSHFTDVVCHAKYKKLTSKMQKISRRKRENRRLVCLQNGSVKPNIKKKNIKC